MKSPDKVPSSPKWPLKVASKPRLVLIPKNAPESCTAMSTNCAPWIFNPEIVIEPCHGSSPALARSTTTCSSLPGICTAPSHRPLALSSALQMSAEAKTNRTTRRIARNRSQILIIMQRTNVGHKSETPGHGTLCQKSSYRNGRSVFNYFWKGFQMT